MSKTSKDYEKWFDRYMKNFCTEEQLRRLVALNQITDSEFKTILNEKELKEMEETAL